MTAVAGSRPAIAISGKTAVPGFQYGLRHPALLVNFSLAPPHSRAWLTEVQSTLVEALSEQGYTATSKKWAERTAPAVNWVAAAVHWVHQLQQAARLPVFERGRIVFVGAGAHDILAAVTCFDNSFAVTAAAIAWLLGVFNTQHSGEDQAETIKSLPDILRTLEAARLPPPTHLFLKAAHAAELPGSRVVEDLFQFGHGVRGRRIYLTCTDETSLIATRFGRLKDLASKVLAQCGVPVPVHSLVATPSEAVEAAERIGYPVVIKPANLDRGVAVATGLQTADEVEAAFAEARAHTEAILVEKHIEGNDYRLLLYKGELLAAIHRVPGGVVGDGVSSIATLLERLNADPRRGPDQHSPLYRVDLDSEALALLRRAGRTLESVPAPGEFVPLRYAGNIARGGTLTHVLGKVHPDNRRLAARAAAALQIDICGVDMIVPDIERSWLETGAAICEVNPGPDLGQVTTAHIFPIILQRLVAGSGRIPVALVLGAEPDCTLVADIARRLTAHGLSVGWTDRAGVWVGADLVAPSPITAYAGGRMLLLDKNVEVALLSADAMGVLRTGLPTDQYDVAVLAGSHIGEPCPPDPRERARVLDRALHVVLPGCRGSVLRARGAPMLPNLGLHVVGNPDAVIGHDDIVEQAAAMLAPSPPVPRNEVPAAQAPWGAPRERERSPLPNPPPQRGPHGAGAAGEGARSPGGSTFPAGSREAQA